MSALADVPALITAEELLDRAGQGRWELVRGELREMPPAGGEHRTYGANLYPRTRKVYGYRPRRDVRVLSVSDTLPGEEVVPGFELPVQEISE